MKKCAVYGNCQAIAIRDLLAEHSEFSKHYEIIPLRPVHLLAPTDVADLEQVVGEVDLFVYQPVSDNYKGIPKLSTQNLLKHLKSSGQSISFPVAYFTGYNPEITYLRDQNNIVTKPFSYHDLNILKLYAQGKDIEETLATIRDESFYDPQYVKNNLHKTLSTLEVREQDLDIKISDFIRHHFQQSKLFHTFNHPSSRILLFIIHTLLNQLGMATDLALGSRLESTEILSQSSFPLYPSLQKALGMNFTSPEVYSIDKKQFSQREVIEEFFQFYNSTQEKLDEYLLYTTSRV